MNAIGFDNDKYLSMQSQHIADRIRQFGGKLYMEFGGKLFDDYHASRVLPGFQPDSKLQLLLKMKDQAEIVIAINSQAIEDAKIRGDLGITYDQEVMRLIDAFRDAGLYVGSVCLTQWNNQKGAKAFEKLLEKQGIKTYKHYTIPNYPYDVGKVISDEGLGKNEYIETTRSLIVITAPGPGSGKMATCISQLYHENKRGIKAGYAKFETFPIWNLPLLHPVNLAYEAATADLNDVNMIDPYHLAAYGVSTVNYNRDIEIFPVLNKMFEKIYGSSPYKSPTDMGVNMAGNCIIDDEVCQEASKQEIIRRYFKALSDRVLGHASDETVNKIDNLMKNHGISVSDRKCVQAYFAGINDKVTLLPKGIIEPVCELKTRDLHAHNPRLHLDEILLALSISAVTNPLAELAMAQLPKLRGSECHSSVILSQMDNGTLRKLGINLTCEPVYETKKLYHSK